MRQGPVQSGLSLFPRVSVENSTEARYHQRKTRKKLKLPWLPSSHEESHFVCQWTNSLKAHNLLKMEIDNLNSPITIKETEFVIKIFLEEKSPGPHCFIREFYQMVKEESTQSRPENTRIKSTSQFTL